MDEKSVEQLLEEVIRNQMDCALGDSESENRAKDLDALEKLYKLRIEEKKVSAEREANEAARNAENRDRKFRLGVDIAAVVLPLVFYGRWMSRGFKFEETHTFTSTTFRSLFNKFRPTR